MNKNNIFPAHDVDSNKTGWIVDLSGPDAVNPDCYWYFRTRRECVIFWNLVANGDTPKYARNLIESGWYK